MLFSDASHLGFQVSTFTFVNEHGQHNGKALFEIGNNGFTFRSADWPDM